MNGPRAVWMDQGGTFTDVLVLEGDRLSLRKVWTDSADLVALGEDAADVRRGTTVATNALLEGTGRPVLLLTTLGLGDLVALGDQRRPDLFSLHRSRRAVEVAGVVEVEGRISAEGTVLTPAGVSTQTLKSWVGRVDAVAVVLAHGPLAPEEERRLGRLCKAAGHAQVSLGHEVAPSRGLLDRLVTTIADASLSPLLPRAPGHYLRSDGGLAREGLEGALADEWRGSGAVLSGPAGGVIACADLAGRFALGRCFSFDMGGTSTDVACIDGRPRLTDHVVVDGLRLRVPAVDLETVAAGGGSRLSVRAGLLVVGPQSAGSDPGPACYGRGGPATLTDCEAVLGRLPGFPSVCGPDRSRPLDITAAREALRRLVPGQDPEDTAHAFVQVAHQNMANALQRLGAREGVDPRQQTLLAFGGAGPGHACGVADRLGIRRVVVPGLAGAFSAYGIGRAVRTASVVVPVVSGDVAAAAAEALRRCPFPGAVQRVVALRHQGTTTLLEVPWGEDLDAAFHQEHEQRFGFRRPGLAIEAVEVRVRVQAAPEPAPTHWPTVRRDRREDRAWFGGWKTVPVVSGGLSAPCAGPALLLGDGTTVVVPPGWVARPLHDAAGDATELRRVGPVPSAPSPDSSMAAASLFATQLEALAEAMGARLQRLARSVSMRERLDFSCAVFDRDGQLVVNAPHVPVHLGAMGETLRDLLARRRDRLGPGQCWASNDPYAGGSHLPDITVMQPVYVDGDRCGFVACRGHHIDVGGSRPGSMPPDSTTLDEEGFVLRQVCLLEDGTFLPPTLDGCREPQTVLADLQAQVAACQEGARRLRALADSLPPEGVQKGFAALLEAGFDAARAALLERPGRAQCSEVLDDGTRLEAQVEIRAGHAVVSLSGPAHPGNRNAPTAVARAAVLYVLKVLLGDGLPLNEGALRAVTLRLEPGGLCDPRPPAAVVGGNVETSQRIVDALFRALGVAAASQGTMNNLIVGTREGAFYETLAGGGGAGPGFAGLSATQVHMTNTAATDVEELEHRFPVRVREWSVRRESGGKGAHRGGDGIVKEIELLEPAEVALLVERRCAGAPGHAGGAPGQPGRDLCHRGTAWEPSPAQWTASPGDRIRVETPGGGGWGEPTS